MRLAAITHRSVTQFAGRFASRCAIAPLEPIPIVPCTGTDPRCGLTGVSPLWLVRSVSPTLRSAGTPSLAIHPPSCGSRPGGVGGFVRKGRTFARKSARTTPVSPPLAGPRQNSDLFVWVHRLSDWVHRIAPLGGVPGGPPARGPPGPPGAPRGGPVRDPQKGPFLGPEYNGYLRKWGVLGGPPGAPRGAPRDPPVHIFLGI